MRLSPQELTKSRNSTFPADGENLGIRCPALRFRRDLGRIIRQGRKQKGAEPRPLREPPPRGTKEQHMASAPDGARLKCCLFGSRAQGLRLAVFSKAALNAHASIRIVGCRPNSAGNRLCVKFCSGRRPPHAGAVSEADAPSQFINLTSCPTVFHSHSIFCNVCVPSRQTNC